MSRVWNALDDDPRLAAGVAIGGALLLWVAITWTAALSVGEAPWTNSAWIRWDSEHYLSIAEHGYEVGPCVDVPFRDASDTCGNAGWFPGYPYVTRLTSRVGLSASAAGWMLSISGLLALFATVWTGFLARRPRAQGILGMALVAAFPSSVYYGAVFPISLLVAAMAGCLALVERRRWAWAGALGAAATVLYPSGVVIGVVAIVPLLDRAVGTWPERLRAASWLGFLPALAYTAVHAEMWRTTGRWSAWFAVMAGYRLEPTSPLEAIARQLARFTDGSNGWIAVQTVFVLLLVSLALLTAWEQRHDLGLGERAAVLLVLALWLAPLTVGAALSLWRAEAILVPAVILLSRLPARAVASLTALAIPLSFSMARLFFEGVLI